MKRAITAADILPHDAYARVRDETRSKIIAMKQNRRVGVGPYATFYFENYDTMWLQIQEMLRIEKGGEAQLKDELQAYNPLIPNGRELTATVMFEIPDAERRAQVLATLGGVEKTFSLRFAGEIVAGKPEEDLDYTSAEGKASSVQFVHFIFTPAQIDKFRTAGEITIAVGHPNYGHMAVMQQATQQELCRDFE